MATLDEVFDLPFEFVAVVRIVAVVAMEATILGRISAVWRGLHLPWPFYGRVVLNLEQDVTDGSSE